MSDTRVAGYMTTAVPSHSGLLVHSYLVLAALCFVVRMDFVVRLTAVGMMVQLLKSWLGVGILVVGYMVVSVLWAVVEMGLVALEL